MIKFLLLAQLFLATSIDTLFARGDNLGVFNLSEYCTPETKDVAPIINNLLKKGNVYIPSGEWHLDSKIILPSGKKIYGEGRDLSVLYADKPLRMVEIVGDVNEICNIHFKGANITDKDSYLLFKRKGTKNLIVRDCDFEGATGGIFINSFCDSIYVLGCQFSKMYPCKKRITSGYGIVFNHNDKYSERGVINGVIERNTFRETVYRHSLYLQSCEDIVVRGNEFYSTNDTKYTSYEFQVLIRGGRNLIFENNKICDGYGFINSTSSNYHGHGSNIIIRNNEFKNNISNGKKMGIINIKFNKALIYNNVFQGFSTTGIYVANMEDVVIEGNRFELKPNANYPIVDVAEKEFNSLLFKSNIIRLPMREKKPAVRIIGSKARSLVIENNVIMGGAVGVKLFHLDLDSLIITGNKHDGILCDYSYNSIKTVVKYNGNKARRHPRIKVSGVASLEAVDNIMQ